MKEIIEISTLLASLAAAIFSIINTWSTNKANKEIAKRNAELQEKLQQKNIDANLKAQARIQWIESVRLQTSEFLAAHRNYVIQSYVNAQRKMLDPLDVTLEESIAYSEFKQSGEFLILYFANLAKNDEKFRFSNNRNRNFYNFTVYPNLKELEKEEKEKASAETIENEKLQEKLLNKENNKDKNHLIISLIDDILQNPQKVVGRDHLDSPDSATRHDSNYNEITNHNLKLLRDSIGLYLKIEWDIAKKGK